MRAAAILQDQLKGCENVTFLWDTEITRIVGEEHVEGLWMKHVKTGEERMLDLDGVFIAVGMTPETEIVSKLLQTDETGYIVAGEDTATSQPGIFAAGCFMKFCLALNSYKISHNKQARPGVAAFPVFLWIRASHR